MPWVQLRYSIIWLNHGNFDVISNVLSSESSNALWELMTKQLSMILKFWLFVFNPQALGCLPPHTNSKCHSSVEEFISLYLCKFLSFQHPSLQFFTLFSLVYCFFLFFLSGFSEFNRTKGQDVCSPGFLA